MVLFLSFPANLVLKKQELIQWSIAGVVGGHWSPRPLRAFCARMQDWRGSDSTVFKYSVAASQRRGPYKFYIQVLAVWLEYICLVEKGLFHVVCLSGRLTHLNKRDLK